MKGFLDYLSRIGKSRGFGIQSPWAYGFVRDVLMERLPYYAYSEIDDLPISRFERKKRKLYHRLKNYAFGHDFYVFDAIEMSVDTFIEQILKIDSCSVVCIENIYWNEETRYMWEEIKNLDCVGVTFDLYRLAVVFRKSEIFKQHYKLNF